MAANEIVLRHGLQANMNIGSFGVIYADEGSEGPPEVLISVAAEEAQKFVLHPGDTFPVRDQTWKLDKVENPGGRD
ncbi:MAG TPA: DUF6406 domain-containing protein [Actinoallomurus sp.]